MVRKASESPSSGVGQGLKPRKSRTRTGCLCCRLRRKKCDERKPVCRGCERNELLCTWPENPDTFENGKTSDLGWRQRLQKGRLRASSVPTDSTVDSFIPTDSSVSADPASVDYLPSVGDLTSFPLTIADRELIQHMDPRSESLLDHFVRVTGPQCVAKPVHQNGLITLVLPLAYSDGMIMDAILALSGAQMAYKEGNAALKAHTLTHYGSATRKLKAEITKYAGSPSGNDVEGRLRLLTTVLILYYFETVSGNPRSTGSFHIRAADEIVRRLMPHSLSETLNDLFGFLLECHVYFSTINYAWFQPSATSLFLPGTFESILAHLELYPTYGSMLGCSAELFALIPIITAAGQKSPITPAIYYALEQKICNWTPKGLYQESVEWDKQLLDCGRVYQCALQMILDSHYYAHVPDGKKLLAEKADALTRELLQLLPLLDQLPLQTVTLWPAMIVGSCAVDRGLREGLMNGWAEYGFQMPTTLASLRTLERSWRISSKTGDAFAMRSLEKAVRDDEFCFR